MQQFALVCFAFIALVGVVKCTVIYNNDISALPTYMGIANSPYVEGVRKRCPLCDRSVYSYCSEKLFHDSCCCHNNNNPYDRLPYECRFADCSFLHSNTCYEHKLITACCCTNYLK